MNRQGNVYYSTDSLHLYIRLLYYNYCIKRLVLANITIAPWVEGSHYHRTHTEKGDLTYAYLDTLV